MKYIIILIIIFSFCGSISAQLENHKKKPVVALVLSGGTAKGLSHVGILKTLEEIEIRPDVIIGTSMGSIIGGLYAMGYSADQLEQMAVDADWYKYLSNNTDLRNITITEKDDIDNYSIIFPIEKRKPNIGKGLIYGHELELFLNKLTYPSYKYQHFDSLPIPFRAITVDVLNAEKHVIEDGALSFALRSSMSLPTILIPKKHENKILVDGGIMDNFGVDVALEYGADIIIGANVGRFNMDEKELESMTNIFWLVMMLQSKQNYDQYKDSVNVLIEAPVLKLGTRFDKVQEIIDIGYQTAQSHLPALLKIKKELEIYDNISNSKSKIDLQQTFQIEFIEIRGITNKKERKEIQRFFNRKFHNKEITSNAIEEQIKKIYGSGAYGLISYAVKKNDFDKFGILFEFEELSKSSIQLGLHYSNQVDIGIVAGISSKNTLMSNSKFKIKGRISKFPGLDQYLIKYIGHRKRFAFKQSFEYITDKMTLYKNSDKITSFERSFVSPSFSCLFIPQHDYLWEFGYQYDYIKYSNEFKTSFEDILNTKLYQHQFYLDFYKNTVDSKYFATTGNILKTSIRYKYIPTLIIEDQESNNTYIHDENILSFQLSWKNYLKLSKNWILENTISGEITTIKNSERFVLKQHVLGGIFSDHNKQVSFWGLTNNRIITANHLLLGTGLRYNITNSIVIQSRINGALIDNGEYIYGMGVTASLETPIGPLSAGISTSFDDLTPIFHLSLSYFR